MTTHRYPIVILSSIPAGGKSTIITELCDLHQNGVHLEADLLRNVVVKGFAPLRPPTDESKRQFDIACQNISFMARTYHENDFFVVIDDILIDPAPYRDLLSNLPVFSAFIKPALEEGLRRNEERDNNDFDTRTLNQFIREFYQELEQSDFVKHWDLILDNTNWDEKETAMAIHKVVHRWYHHK